VSGAEGGRNTGRPSFSEEKEAKRLLFRRKRKVAGHGLNLGSRGNIKVFCFFSSEKKDFLLLWILLRRESPHPPSTSWARGFAVRVILTEVTHPETQSLGMELHDTQIARHGHC
jgi:hypothetical protein